MAGRSKAQETLTLASNRQLWRLNTLGRLALAEDARPIRSQEASALIATLIQRQDVRGPRRLETARQPA